MDISYLFKNIISSFGSRLLKAEYKLGLIADYVIESGTSGSWTYRKWNSGVSECWGKWSNNVAVNSSWGVLYEGKFSDPISYPSGLFLQTPALIGSISGTAGFLEISGAGDATKTGAVYIVRPYSTQSNSYQVNLHAFGRWK